jgi:hypothetical protein
MRMKGLPSTRFRVCRRQRSVNPEMRGHCSPEEAVFIDDREINVAAVSREGISSLLYRSTDQLRLEPQDMAFDVRPPDSNAAKAMQVCT